MHFFSLLERQTLITYIFNGEEGGISSVFEVGVSALVSRSCQGNVTYEHRTAACLPQAGITFPACSGLHVVYLIYKKVFFSTDLEIHLFHIHPYIFLP